MHDEKNTSHDAGRDGLPYRHECTCACHTTPGMTHIRPCCRPATRPPAQAGAVPAGDLALAKAVRFTAYDRADPLAIRFEFADDADRLEAADEIDVILSEAFAQARARMAEALAEARIGRDGPVKVRLKSTAPTPPDAGPGEREAGRLDGLEEAAMIAQTYGVEGGYISGAARGVAEAIRRRAALTPKAPPQTPPDAGAAAVDRDRIVRLVQVARTTRDNVLRFAGAEYGQHFAGLNMACDNMEAALSTPAASGEIPGGVVMREAIAQIIRSDHRTRNDRVEDEFTISFPTTHHGEYRAADRIIAITTPKASAETGERL